MRLVELRNWWMKENTLKTDSKLLLRHLVEPIMAVPHINNNRRSSCSNSDWKCEIHNSVGSTQLNLTRNHYLMSLARRRRVGRFAPWPLDNRKPLNNSRDFSRMSYAVKQVDWLSDDRTISQKKCESFPLFTSRFPSFWCVADDEKNVFRVWWAGEENKKSANCLRMYHFGNNLIVLSFSSRWRVSERSRLPQSTILSDHVQSSARFN